jgi:transketolase
MRHAIIEQSRRANVGHIGSALSIVELLATLFADELRLDGDDRDRLVLSKGHAALALYAALRETGRFGESTAIESFCGDGSVLGVHPESEVDGIDFSTGSLGQGLSIGVGAALAARLQGSSRRAFVVMSDAELNEGSVWEAIMLAAQHRLGNLIALVDLNGQQALGYTRDVIDLEPVKPRFEAFGWAAQEVDGHDPAAISAAIRAAEGDAGRPHVLLARTTFGRGVTFMESKIEWHYLPLDEQQYLLALAELGIGVEAPA